MSEKRKRKPTSTSSFGSGPRESHDASRFYASALAKTVISDDSTIARPPEVDQLWCHSAEKMKELPDNSVALVVTSPPYHAGKALRSTEPVLCPNGWRKIGDLVPGDQVMGLDGLPTLVEAVHPQGSRQLYRLTFDDGTTIDADGSHLWRFQTYDDQQDRPDHWRVESTLELLSRGSHPKGPRAIRLPAVGPLEFVASTYPLDPYTLGVLAGDGTVVAGGYARVTLGKTKMGVLAALPYRTNPYKNGRSWGVLGLGPTMRQLGLDDVVCPAKFIPESYLLAPSKIRLAVLHGLMDTDGYCDKRGTAHFASSSPRLVDAVEFLVQTFGGKSTRSASIPTYEYKGEKLKGRPSERLSLTLLVCPFLHRQDARQRWESGQAKSGRRRPTNHRILRSVEPVDTDEATCITVAAEDGCFLARGCVPTHNSYDTNSTFPEYLALLRRVFKECYRVLEPGGRIVINAAGLGRKPYVPLPDLITDQMRRIGYHSRGEIIWIKGEGMSGNCAWGSFMSPANPVLRDLHEVLLVGCKGRFDRALSHQKRKELGLPYQATITKEDFMAWTLSIWNMRPESARRVDHPAPFPVELPRRCIELFTYRDDVVLDPFMGAGATAVAAVETGRRYVGYDTNQDYLDKAEQRIAEART